MPCHHPLHFTSLLQCPAWLCKCSTHWEGPHLRGSAMAGGAELLLPRQLLWVLPSLELQRWDATQPSKQAQGNKQEEELIILLKWRTKNKMKRRKEMLCWQVCLQICPLKHQPALGAVQCPGGMAGAVQSCLWVFQPFAASGGASSNEIQWTESWH